MKNKFIYQSEKLNAARSSLMAPHPAGEVQGFTNAFYNCFLAFDRFNVDDVKDDSAREWIRKILHLIDTTGLQDTSGKGLWQVRAEQMSLDEKMEFSRSVDELASWFDRNFWQD